MLMQNESVPSNVSATKKVGGASNVKEESDDEGSMNDLRQTAHEFQDRNGQHHPIAEFLYQLTKMLTDDNSEVIEWADGKIRVHHPERLEAEVLHKYFRHSKFASFQRQLNYFGFRKIAGKGKMSPCSYVNDAATSDIRSLLLIKRKTNGSAARKAAMQHRSAGIAATLNPGLAGMNLQALASATGQPMGVLNTHALTSAMALLQENALRAGLGLQHGNSGLGSAQLGLFALQHQQQQQQQQLQQELQNQQILSSQQQLSDQQRQQLAAAVAQFGMQPLEPPSQLQQQQQQAAAPVSNAQQTMEQQIQAHLAAFGALHQNGGNANALNLAASLPALASLKLAAAAAARNASNGANRNNNYGANDNPASAALNAQISSMPATAAMNAATAQSNPANLFDSTANLRSLLNEHHQIGNNNDAANRGNNNSHQFNNNTMTSMASQALLNRLPSSGTLFPDNSVLNFGNMLGSSNRLSSLLSLNSFVGSRETSLADLAAATAGMAANNRQQAMADAQKSYRSSNPK